MLVPFCPSSKIYGKMSSLFSTKKVVPTLSTTACTISDSRCCQLYKINTLNYKYASTSHFSALHNQVVLIFQQQHNLQQSIGVTVSNTKINALL